MKRKNRGLKLIGVPVESELHDAIVSISRANDQKSPLPLAQVARDLLWQAINDGAGERVLADLADQGYQEGLRRGMHEVRQHMKKLYGGK